MSHYLTSSDQMMYAYRSPEDTPWHGLGVPLPNVATAAEAMEAANLAWEVSQENIYRKVKNGTDKPKLVPYPNAKFNVRSDTNEILGIVGKRYQIFQNLEAFKFFDEVTCDPGGPKYVTAGSLKGGRIVWALAKLGSFVKVTNQDGIDEYVLLVHSHDGSRSVQMLYTPVRVVCWNTLMLALGRFGKSKKNGHIKLKHTLNIGKQVKTARAALGILEENHSALSLITEKLLQYEPSEREVTEVLTRLFAEKTMTQVENLPETVQELDPTQSKHPITELLAIQTRNAIIDTYNLYRHGTGQDLPGIAGTSWALYNGITEWVDYTQPTKTFSSENDEESAENKLLSIWQGTGANLKQRAFELVYALGEK